MKNTHVLLIKFKNKISDDEVQFFRSSIIQKLGDQPDILYHNHVEKNKYRYSYPLIQYKNIEQQAQQSYVLIKEQKQLRNSFHNVISTFNWEIEKSI